jgi:predicted DNA-binding transcriptional regulator AlpA
MPVTNKASLRCWIKQQIAELQQCNDEQNLVDDPQYTVDELREYAIALKLPDVLKVLNCRHRLGTINRLVTILALLDTPNDLLNADQVAEMFKVNKRTIRRRVLVGEFPAPVKIGRSIRWRCTDLERLW